MKTLLSALILSAALAADAAVTGTVAAQDATLDRVQNMMAAGRFSEATATLAQWEKSAAEPRATASTADRARALYLRGVLSTDTNAAEEAFIQVVLSYPFSAVAPQALLRLGQALVTAGEHTRAIAYLERLRSDYPGVPERETGLLWLARAQRGAGSTAAACTTARNAADTRDVNLRTLIELERDRACGDGAAAATAERAQNPGTAQASPPVQTNKPAGTDNAPGTPANVPVVTKNPPVNDVQVRTAANGNYAVQSGAFTERRSAEGVAAQLRAQGFDARVVLVENSPLQRVRVGVFATSADATAVSVRVRAAGFAAIVVNDVKRERTP